jgi:hypothetical protein
MATYQPIAAQVSAPAPLSGQKNRSSNNFQFLEVPSSGNVTASMPGGISCSIMQDVSGGTDPIITTVTNGSTFAASKVKKGTNYYYASPGGAPTNFEVTLSGDV